MYIEEKENGKKHRHSASTWLLLLLYKNQTFFLSFPSFLVRPCIQFMDVRTFKGLCIVGGCMGLSCWLSLGGFCCKQAGKERRHVLVRAFPPVYVPPLGGGSNTIPLEPLRTTKACS